MWWKMLAASAASTLVRSKTWAVTRVRVRGRAGVRLRVGGQG